MIIDATHLTTLTLGGIDMLVSADDERVRVWDPRTGKQVSESAPLSGGITAIAVCPVGWRDPLIVAATDDEVSWLEPRTGGPAYSPDRTPYVGALGTWAGTLLAGSVFEPYAVQRWDAGTGCRLEPLGVHEDQVTAITVLDLPDGPIVCVADKSGTIRRWNPCTGASAGTPLDTNDDVVMQLSQIRLPDGRLLIAAASADLYRWDALTGEPVGVPVVVDSYAVAGLTPVLVNGRAELITTGADEVVQRWDATTGEQVGAPVPGRSATVLSRYGELNLAIATLDGHIDLRVLGQPHPDRRT
ncbi:WD40 repeat domain-containing protein [Actinoplanes sp. NPDC051851]|uniref:WD40 repeat domain-containing protein n=1 Tax=Actinoplanes sp. NPDC051851 TaxID=3154753 RepID=UPI0034431501